MFILRWPPWYVKAIRLSILTTAVLAPISWLCMSPAFPQEIMLPAVAQREAVELEEEDDDPQNQVQRGVVFGGIDESNFEAWIWNGAAQNPAGGKARLQSQLDLQIADIARACNLTEAQTTKLKLAGATDIKRFFERYYKLRKLFLKVRNDQNAMNNFWAELQPLQMEIQSGVFNEESLFQRVVPKSLEPKQRETYERESLARRTFRLNAKLELLMVAADESMGLRIEQREKLTELCRKHVRVPKRFGQYDSYVIIYEMSRVPEEEVKKILDEEQMKGWQQAIAQGKGMEQFLRQNKMLPDFDPPANEPNAAPKPDVKPEETTVPEKRDKQPAQTKAD
ncbi:MAG: hypothetical protein NT069_32120, partial [Planctomycetota bacterium]|nr:hypothetical protein [Planctomycetota bacterium]